MALLPRRSDRWEREIDALDPVEDCHAVVRILGDHLFPLDLLLVTELGQLRTFSVPSISSLLHRTGEYERRSLRRLDDTKAMLSDILRRGPRSPGGAEMIAHLNHIHSHYDITNDDYLYTLSVFVVDVVRWMEERGPRPLRPAEVTAIHAFYTELGEAMGVEDIPPDAAAFAAWRDAYEAEHQRYTPANEAVARGLLRGVRRMVPAPAAPFVEAWATRMLREDALVEALGLERPGLVMGACLGAAEACWRAFDRRYNPWEEQPFTEGAWFNRYRSYPDGFDRMRLGPSHLLRRRATA